MKKILIVAIIAVLLAVGGFAFWYFAIREDNLDVSARNVDTGQSTDIEEQDSPIGDWTISQQDDVFVGYEILELFGGRSVKTTAIGKSTGVTGSFSLNETELSDAEIVVDMTQLESDSSSRDSKMQTQGLETNNFGEAQFTQSDPVTFSEEITKNSETIISIPGRFTLRGVTRDITVDLTALWDGRVITVSGEIDIVLSEYDIEPPESPLVSVDNEGKVKLQLLFIPKN